MNFSLKTNESSVLKTIFSIMSGISPFGYLAVTKDGMEITCEELDYGHIKMKFEIIPEKLLMFEHHRDMHQPFFPSDMVNYLRKVSKGDTLKISDDVGSIELYSVSQKRDMSVRTTFRRSRAEYVDYSFREELYNSPGVLVNTRDFFTACENTNNNISNCDSVTKMKLIGKFGLEIGFETEFVSRCVTRLGDIESTYINHIFNKMPEYTFKTQKIMVLRKIQNISPKIRLYFRSGLSMLMVADTSLGPLKFLVQNC